MASSSASGLRPVRTSASMPRSPKISTARGLSSSAIRTLGMRETLSCLVGSGTHLLVRPLEPREQGFEIAALDGGAGPDPQARRRLAVRRDVVGDALLLEQLGDLAPDRNLGVRRQRGEPRVG